MSQYVDLHSHSTASDGTLAPREVVRLAKEVGLLGLALTDHDTINGLADAADEAAALCITVIPGIEISAIPPEEDGTLHILGLCIDPRDPILLNMARQLIEARNNRNPQIVEELNRLGVDVTMEEWRARAQGGVLGRPQLAALLVEKGVVKTIKQAFNEYLGQGGKAYFDKERLPPRDAIGRIRAAGGIPILAHAIQLRTTNDAHLERVVKDLVDLGLEGIEVIHSDLDDSWVDKCLELAERYNLLKTGGSDFHGANKKDVHLGVANGRKVPREYMDRLIERSVRSKATAKA